MRHWVRLIIAVLCSQVACASGPEPPPLVVSAGFDQLDLVVINGGGQTWEDCRFTLDPGGYTTTWREVKGGDRVRIPVNDLADADGRRFDVYHTKPGRLTVTATVQGHPMTWTSELKARR